MSGFLGVLHPPAAPAHLEDLVREDGHPTPVPPYDFGSNSTLEASGWRNRPTTCASLETSQRVASVVLKVQALTELIKAKTNNCCGEEDQ